MDDCNLINCDKCDARVPYDDAVWGNDDNEYMLCIECYLQKSDAKKDNPTDKKTP